MLSEIKINDVYTFSHIENKRQLSFLEFFGCSATLIDKCVKEDNDRIAGRRPTPGYRKPGPKPKDKANKNRSPAAMTSAATLSTEVSAGAANTTQPSDPRTHETSNGDVSISDSTAVQSPAEHSDTKPNLRAEPKKRGVKPGTKRGDFNKDGTPRKKPGVQSGTKRSLYKNDGTLRQKPGPKPKIAAAV